MITGEYHTSFLRALWDPRWLWLVRPARDSGWKRITIVVRVAVAAIEASSTPPAKGEGGGEIAGLRAMGPVCVAPKIQVLKCLETLMKKDDLRWVKIPQDVPANHERSALGIERCEIGDNSVLVCRCPGMPVGPSTIVSVADGVKRTGRTLSTFDTCLGVDVLPGVTANENMTAAGSKLHVVTTGAEHLKPKAPGLWKPGAFENTCWKHRRALFNSSLTVHT